jgi:hypothetical protein
MQSLFEQPQLCTSLRAAPWGTACADLVVVVQHTANSFGQKLQVA